jgi:hypothetical protein
MDSISNTPHETARKTASKVLQALSDNKASQISTITGMLEALISRLKNDHLSNFALVLAHLGLKVVPSHKLCFDPEYVASLRFMARTELNRKESATSLDWDE